MYIYLLYIFITIYLLLQNLPFSCNNYKHFLANKHLKAKVVNWWPMKTKIMASGPITSWEIDGETVKTVADFVFLDSKITADGESSHEMKRRLFLRRKIMTNLDSIFKSRGITLPTKFTGFSSSRYGCKSWTIKKAERRRIAAFELWCWRRVLRVPWTQGDPTSPS